MRRGLIWTLGATLVLSAWALLKPASSDAPATAATLMPKAPRTTGTTSPAPRPAAIAAAASLPEHWPTPAIEPATRNPFIEPQPPAPKPPPTPPPPPPPPPPMPVAGYRFWGRMLSPEGRKLVFIARGDTGAPVAVEPGALLEDGWSIESIGDNAIVLVQAATNARSTVAIPAATAPGTH